MARKTPRRRPPKIGRGRITMCRVSPAETQRPRRLYRHRPAPGRQVGTGGDFECVVRARLCDVSLIPALTPQPVGMLCRQPCARGSAHFRQHLAEHRRASSSASAFVPVEGCDDFLHLRLIPGCQLVGDENPLGASPR
jgi:hypothetical protein